MAYENIRSWDKQDLKAIPFSNADYEQLQLKLDNLSSINRELALRIEIGFKTLRPEFIKTADGFSYSSSKEIAEYSRRRYGIELEEKHLEQLDDDAKNTGNKVYLKAILDVDYKALEGMTTKK